VNRTGTNLKSTTKKIDNPKNHSNALNKKRVSLLLKVPESFFDVIFVAIICKSEIFIKVKKIASVL
jgi:low temperature requirement protein LtrA